VPTSCISDEITTKSRTSRSKECTASNRK
jgi:hypothetical protein